MNNMYPNGKASSARVREYGKGFVQNGIETIVLMPQPRIPYNHKKINPNKGVDSNGVKYYNLSGSSKRNKYLPIRLFLDIYGEIITLLWLLFNLKKDDYVVLYEGCNSWFKKVISVCKVRKVKIGMELNELPHGTSTETPQTIKKRGYMLKEIFHRFDFFLCISQSLCDLANKYSPDATIIKVPIISEGDLEGEDFIEEKPKYIFHSGTLYEQKDGLCGMLHAFGMASSNQACKDLKYFLTGNLESSQHESELRQIIKEYDIEEKVHFLGYLDLPTLRKYQKNALMTIINKYNTQQNQYCFSTKLSEYLSFSIPVITTTVGEANYYLKDGENAYIVEPHKPELIAEKIIHIMKNQQEAIQIGKEGYKLTLKEFNCVYQTEKIIRILKACQQ